MSDAVRRRRLWSLGLAAIVVVSIGPAADARARFAVRFPAVASETAAAPCGPGDSTPSHGPGTWFRLDPVLDDEGVLAGQRLVAGRLDDAATLPLALDPESFASGPTDGLLLVGTDDGRRSIVRVVDVARGCVVASVVATDVVRRAVLDMEGGFVYEHRVERRTRSSLGVWRRPVDDLDRDRPVLGPLPANDRVGLVFATELIWSTDGGTLAVLSCGEAACVTRLVDTASGAVRLVDDVRLGEVLGVADGRLVGYGACAGLPCPIVAYDPDAQTAKTIAQSAGLVRVVQRADGGAVAFEDVADGGLRVVDLDGRVLIDIPRPSDGQRLLPPSHLSMADVELAPGWLAIGPDGRPGGSSGSDLRLVDADDGSSVTGAEVVP